MNTNWQDGYDRQERRRTAQFKSRTNMIRFRGRIDIVFFCGLLLAGVGLAVALFLIFQITDLLGLRNNTLLQELADERKLVNVRDGIRDHALLDAAYHAPERKLYVSQQGGTLHQYDPSTRLWSSEQPFAKDEDTIDNTGIDSDLTALRSGDGSDNTAPDALLWGRSKEGGLVVRLQEEWQTVFGDRPFTDRDGNPVEGRRLRCAAVSSDGQWLVVGTDGAGMGLYALQSHTWMHSSEAFRQKMARLMPSGHITHLTWWQDRFWVGGVDGLLSVTPGSDGLKVDDVIMEHAVKDMDADPDGALWVLANRQCAGADTTADCLWFAALDSPDQVRVLMDERNIFPQLDLADLFFAEQSGPYLTLAGGTGVFVYDTLNRRWSQPFSGQILDVIRLLDEGSGFAFGYVGGFGFSNLGKITTWPVSRSRVIKVSGRARDRLLALTDTGRIYGLNKEGNPKRLFNGIPTGSGGAANFTHGLTMEDEILMIGPRYAVVHNVVTRTYRDLDVKKLPSWLRNPRTRLSYARNQVYGLVSAGARTQLFQVPRVMLKAGRKFENLSAMAQIGSGYEAKPWGDYGLVLQKPGSSPLLATSDDVLNMVGAPAQEMDGLNFDDVTIFDDKLVVTNAKGVRYYDLDKRAWSRNTSHPPNDPVVQLEGMPDNLLARTRSGALLYAEPSRRAYEFEEVMGGNRLSISDPGLSDVLMDPTSERLYLAGEGKIEAYSTIKRGVLFSKVLEGKGPVTLAGAPKGVPVALNRGIAHVGDRVLDPAAGTVGEISIGEDMIWTTRTLRGVRYLKGYNVDRPFDDLFAQCYFRNPAPDPKITTIYDARQVKSDVVAVSTNLGLFFYNNQGRTWFPGPPDLLPRGGRIYKLSEEMLLAEERRDGSVKLSFVGLETIQIPHSCATSQVKMVTNTQLAARYAVDEAADKVAILYKDGRVDMRQQAGQWDALVKPGDGPSAAGMRRVFDRRDSDSKALWFTTDTLLYRYDLRQHHWSTIGLNFEDRGMQSADIQVFSREGQDNVWVRTQTGDYYEGIYEKQKSEISLTKAYAAPKGGLGAATDQVLDVQGNDDSIWTVLLRDRVVYFDPTERTWLEGPKIESSTVPFYAGTARSDVVVGNGGKTWWVGRTYGESPGEYTYPLNFARFQHTGVDAALDGSRAIWELTQDGRIVRYPQPSTGNYRNAEEVRPQPYALDVARIRSARQWNNHILFETPVGLTLVDPDSSRELPLPADATIFTGITHAYQVDQDLLLRNQDKIMILTAGNNPQVRLTEKATALVLGLGGTPWAEIDGEWRRYDGRRFARLREGRPNQLFVTAIDGARITGHDGQGRVYLWRNRWQAQPARLPPELGNQPQALFYGPEGHWWAVHNNHLYHLIVEKADTMRIAARLPIPQRVGDTTELTGFLALDRTVNLIGKDGVTFKVHFDVDISHETAVTQGAPSFSRYGVSDSWNTLRNHVVTLPNGSTVYDPVTRFQLDEAGNLVAVRPSGSYRLARDGIVQMQPGEPLATSWLRWDRANKDFLIRGGSANRRLPLNQVLVDGHFIFEHIDALLLDREAPDTYYAANKYGYWRYQGRGLFLNDAAMTFTPFPMHDTIRAAHGSFYHRNGAVNPKTGIIQEKPTMPIIRLGEVELTEHIDKGTVSAEIVANGKRLDAFAAKGFVWDERRLSVAFQNGELLLHSGAGLHGAEDYSGFDGGPAGTDITKGHVFNEPGGIGLTFNDGTQTYRKSGDRWEVMSEDPTGNRTLFQNPAWTWKLNNSLVQVNLVGSERNFSLDGNGFSWDRLRGAVGTTTGLSIMTDAFFETRARPDEIGRLTAPRFPAAAAERLVVRRGGPDGEMVVRQTGDRSFIWDHETSSFVSWESKAAVPIVHMPWLRFMADPNGIRKEMRMQSPGQQDFWTPITFYQGRFPFDVVTSIISDEENIYVGARTGLQVYRTTIPLRLREIEHNFTLNAGANGAPVPVTAVVRDPQSPGRVVALSEAGAVDRLPGRPFAWTDATPEATADVRFDTPLWRWVRQPDGKLSGVYKTADRIEGATVDIRNGRFPHDRIQDMTHWQGRAYTMWGRSVTGFQRIMPELSHAETNWAFDKDPDRFITLTHALETRQGEAPAGIYVVFTDNSMHRFTGVDWLPWPSVANPGLSAALQAYDEKMPIFSGRDLRLPQRRGSNSLQFEHRVSQGDWYPIPWDGDRVSLDRWHDLVQVAGGIWAATSAGFANFQRSGDRLTLDPNDLVIVRDLVRMHPGSVVTDVQATGGNGILLRLDQNSERVYRGRLIPGNDTGGFQKETQDLFAARVLVTPGESSMWEWRLQQRRDGNPGYLTVSLGDEKPQLVGGRFDFDTLNSVALFRDGLVEIATDAAGWYQLLRDDPRISTMQRDRIQGLDPLRVRRIGMTLSGEDKQLILQTYADQTIRMGPRGAPEQAAVFREIQARDGMWDYFLKEDRLEITTRLSRGGGVKRLMIDGKFQDDIITGWPLAMTNQEGVAYIAPTAGGILSLNAGLQPRGIQVGDFKGLPEGTLPHVLFMTPDNRPAYVGSNSFHHLDGTDEQPLAELRLDAPDDYQLTGMAPQAGGAWRLSWIAEEEIGWNRLRGEDLGAFPMRRRYIDVRGLEKFQENRIAWGDPKPLLQAHFNGASVILKLDDFETELPVTLPRNFQLTAQVVAGERLLIFGKHHLYEVNLNQALQELFTNMNARHVARNQ